MKRFRITLAIPDGLKNVPVEVDLSAEAGFNPANACLTDENGNKLPFVLSDEFLYGDTGTLTFLSVDTNIKTYFFYYETGGTKSMPAYAGEVGCGDCLRTAPGSVHPLFQGMSAQGFFADIDNDGQEELITTQMYGSVICRPWHIINAYKAVNGVYSDGIPLRVSYPNGKIDYLHGASCAVCRDGFLYSCGYGGPEGIGIYKLNGTYTLEYVGNIVLPGVNGYISAFQVADNGIYIALSRTVEGIMPDQLWFDATEDEIQNAKWPRWNLEAQILFYAFDSNERTVKAPVPVGIESHIHIYFDMDRTTGDIYACMSNMDLARDGENLATEIVHYRKKGDTLFEKTEQFVHLNSRSTYAITRTKDGRFLCGGGDFGGRLFLDKEPVLQISPFVNAFAGFAKAEIYEDCILSGCETGFVSVIRKQGAYYTEPEVLPIQFSNGAFDDPASLAEGTLGQTSPYYLDVDFDGVPELVVKCGKRLYKVNRENMREEIRTESGGLFGAHRNHIAIGDFTGDDIPDIINVSEDGQELLLFSGYNDCGILRFTDGRPLFYDDGTKIDPSQWHHYTKHFSCGDYYGNGRPDLMLSTCSRILVLENLGGGDLPGFGRPKELLENCKGTDTIGHHVCMPLACDWDKSGEKKDILVCGESGMFYLFRRNYIHKPSISVLEVQAEAVI